MLLICSVLMLLQVSLAPALAGSPLPGATSDMLREVGFMAVLSASLLEIPSIADHFFPISQY
jgi:hypothetical protein